MKTFKDYVVSSNDNVVNEENNKEIFQSIKTFLKGTRYFLVDLKIEDYTKRIEISSVDNKLNVVASDSIKNKEKMTFSGFSYNNLDERDLKERIELMLDGANKMHDILKMLDKNFDIKL